MGRRRKSAREVEQDATEDVGGQLLLSFALLEGLLPVGGSELEDAALGPAREQAEKVADVAVGLVSWSLALARSETKRVLVTAPSSLPTKSQLRPTANKRWRPKPGLVNFLSSL
jgi:hypothetical protein